MVRVKVLMQGKLVEKDISQEDVACLESWRQAFYNIKQVDLDPPILALKDFNNILDAMSLLQPSGKVGEDEKLETLTEALCDIMRSSIKAAGGKDGLLASIYENFISNLNRIYFSNEENFRITGVFSKDKETLLEFRSFPEYCVTLTFKEDATTVLANISSTFERIYRQNFQKNDYVNVSVQTSLPKKVENIYGNQEIIANEEKKLKANGGGLGDPIYGNSQAIEEQKSAGTPIYANQEAINNERNKSQTTEGPLDSSIYMDRTTIKVLQEKKTETVKSPKDPESRKTNSEGVYNNEDVENFHKNNNTTIGEQERRTQLEEPAVQLTLPSAKKQGGCCVVM